MTTVAFKNGFIAADTQAADHSGLISHTSKLFRLSDSCVAGMAGCSRHAIRFIERLKEGKAGDDKIPDGDFLVLVVTPQSIVVYYEDELFDDYTPEKMWAIGSGRLIAMGAMAAGATAQDAVRIASKWDEGTGGDVEVMRVFDGSK
jgi:ATP-dependent HslUV protease subunit HslV|tara:strand:- start:1856 stop:2293 length:438 start_codon:yes stop_codon:yes gene_type:complete